MLVEGRHVRQTGSPGRYAVVRLRVEAGAGFEFVDETAPGFPPEFVAATRRGVEATLGSLTDIRVTLVEAKDHLVDSSERDFEIAAEQAISKALEL
ncbi:hypothetical protein DVA67_015400 [Solirubrobacter sp. CPCC 204708]|uniref:Translation elongation factor EFG/EF2 domain-containing protein n=1 Tax=Solirubrobacter deserti TaxID=2282478 RepID=A0ABT4RKP3_9ACTN|nr:hypothetical protein [Solirubrobacter deserti]MBE2317367.1 hypothetical protein [Solirubrobacter deserti]MDA0139096.1 hypothetical protein [Solirubrobacter deserti]